MLVGGDEVIVVASPDLANLRNAKNIMDNIRGARPHDHPPRLVLNGVGMAKRPEISVSDFAKTIEIDPVAVFPHDAKLFGSAANNGQMIAEIEPKGRCAECSPILPIPLPAAREPKGEARSVRAVYVQVQSEKSVRRVGHQLMRSPVSLSTWRRKETKHVW